MLGALVPSLSFARNRFAITSGRLTILERLEAITCGVPAIIAVFARFVATGDTVADA